MLMRKDVLIVGIFVLLSACISTSKAVAVEMYKSPTCECCAEYGKYLESKNFKVKTIEVQNLQEIRNSLGVPEHVRSCHTMKIGNYFGEGHVPADVIQELLAEQPKIDGIALPGMPQGSPGMGGVKTEPFMIYSISNGKISEFTRR